MFKSKFFILSISIFFGMFLGFFIYINQSPRFNTSVEIRFATVSSFSYPKKLPLQDYAVVAEQIKSDSFKHQIIQDLNSEAVRKILDRNLCSNCLRVKSQRDLDLLLINIISNDKVSAELIANSIYKSIKKQQDNIIENYNLSIKRNVDVTFDQIGEDRRITSLIWSEGENRDIPINAILSASLSGRIVNIIKNSFIVEQTTLLNPIFTKDDKLFKNLWSTMVLFVVLSFFTVLVILFWKPIYMWLSND